MQGGLGGGLFSTPQAGGGLGGGLGRGTTGGLAGLGGGTGGGGLFGNRPGGLFGNTGGGLGGGGAGGSIFGQGTQTQTGGGLFNTGGLGGGTGGLFQTPTSQTGLGQQKTGIGGGLFGQSPALGGGLGGTGGGLFGQGAQTGATGAGGLFAKQTPASSIGGGLFKPGGLGGGLGGILGGNQPVKFEPIKAKDTANKNGVTYNVDTLLHCITGMSQYEQKSLEELRCEDYLAGRKGGSTTGGTAGGLFAAGAGQTTGLGTATTGGLAGGLFAQQNKSLAGGGLFNQQQTLGGLGGGVLGGGALGGASTGGGGLFAQQAQPKLGGGLFGAQNKLGLGGLGAGTAGAGAGGLFNQQTSQAATGGLFANQATTGGGLFNQQQASTGLGGLGGGLLGQPSQLGGGGGLFNRTTTAGTLGLGTGLGGLGTTTTGLGGGGLGAGGLGGLGALSQANTGFFNKPLQTGTLGGLGGGQVGLGLGGAGTLGATGLGGTSSLGLGTGLSTGLGQTQLGGGGMLGGGALGNQNQMANILSLESRREEINSKMESLANHPHGDHPLYRTALLDAAKRPKSKDSTTPVSAKATPTHSPHYKLNMRPSAKFKPLSLRSPARHINKNKLFESLEDSQLASESSTTLMGGASETFVPRRSIKKLTIKPKPSEPQPDSTTPPHSDGHTSLPRPQPRINSAPPTTTVQSGVRPAFEATPTSLRSRGTPPSSARSKDTSIDSPELTLGIAKPKQLLKPVPVRVTPTHSTTGTAAVTTTTSASLAGKSPSQSQSPSSAGTLVRSPLRGLGGVGDEVGGAEGAHPPPAGRSSGIVLTQQDYYTIPSCEELDEMAKDGHCVVEGFTIGRRGYGEIHFPDKTDVYGLNLDQLVIIGEKEVAVYPDDVNKPPVGYGLNKVAIVRLHGNWPVDKTTREKVKDAVRIEKMGYVNKLKRSTAKIGGTFKDYDPDTGTCMFQVEHFSKYKLVADDDDSEGEEQGGEGGVVKKAKTVLQPQAKSGDKPPPVAPVQPVTQTSQSRLRLEDEAMSDEEEDASDVSTTTEPRPLPVLRSQHLASSMGVSSHAVQVMKASFFGEEPFSVPSRPPMFQTTPTPTSLGRDRSSLHHSGRHTPIPSLSSRPHPSGTTPHSMTPPLEAFPHPAVSSLQAQASVIMAKHNLSLLLPLSTSVVNDKTHNIADVGLTMGRSFRVGWGPNWTLAHSGYPVSRSTHSQSLGLFSSTDGGSSWTAGGEGIPLTVSVEQVRVDATKAPCKMGMTELFLRSQLEQSTFSKDAGGDSAPCIAPKVGHALLERFADLARLLTGDPSLCDVATQRQWRRVINLVAVLWGPLPGDVDPDPASYDHQRARRKAIFLWLRETNEMITQEEVASCTDADYLRALFSLVSGQQLSKACRLAQKNRDHKLALLLSQATRNTTYIRTYLRHQLSDWEEQKANMFIEYERLKLYVVLAGLMVWETGTCDINVTEGLDWKRALALHLCYGCGLTASIKEVVDKFNDAFKDNVSPPPLPPYLERHREATPTSCPPPLDTCYHLLQLYCYRDHSLEPTVAPSGSTPFHLDYRISWLLASLLGSLGYTHLHPTRQAHLHSSFGCQLERAGLWHWAVFVLLHINHYPQRELAVKSLLNAHCSSDADLTDLEAFIINKLHVPTTWVYAAKGQSAGYELNYDLQALHLLKAERWNDCHCVIVEKLAASAIINDETSQLLDMLEVLASHCSFIHNWEKAGSVFLDYLHISSRVLQLADSTDDLTDYLLDQLQSGVDKLAVRIHQLPCHTPTDVLCQTEIAKRTANYARVLADIKVEVGLCSDVDMTSVLPHLPLPSDYSLSEFSTLLQPFLKELGTHY